MKFKEGDPVEITAMDHSSDDTIEGWRTAAECMDSQPEFMCIRGFYIGEDRFTMKIAFARCGDSYSTVFNVLKSAIVKQVKKK